MDFTQPLSLSPLRPVSNADFGLRLFQRVTAQVLTVTGVTAVLAIEGHPVVAQLTSADQAAALLSQRTAQFIVTKLTGQEMTLKFVRPDGSRAITAGPNPHGPELALRLLEQNNIPVNVNNLTLARSVLNQGMPLTPGLLNELLGALTAYGSWGETQASLAAALKAAGLPVTVQSLMLASRQAAQTGEALGQLISQLQAAGQNLPPDLLKRIHQNIQLLEELVLSADGDTARLAAQLKAAVNVLGQSPENALLEQAQNPENLSPGKNLLSLVKLQQALELAGKTDLAGAVEKFLGDLHHHQLLNARPGPGPGQEAWSEIGFRLGGERGASARLRVCRESRSNSVENDPTFTRLILQVDVSEDETVEVDLALADKQIRTQVTSPNSAWCHLAESELSSLEAALERLGYSLKEASIATGEPQPFEGLKLTPGGTPLTTVNIEV
jgi:hypothetical protein